MTALTRGLAPLLVLAALVGRGRALAQAPDGGAGAEPSAPGHAAGEPGAPAPPTDEPSARGRAASGEDGAAATPEPERASAGAEAGRADDTPPAAAPAPPRPAADRPWRAHEALGLSWLRFGLEHRTRFEHLENDFRASNGGNATGLSLRTLLSAEVRLLPVVVGFELVDSRAFTADGTPVSTTLVDAVDILSAYVGIRAEDVLARGDALSLTAGRMTIDLGSRRLVARNEFRNTINAFTGLDVSWTSPAHDVVRFLAVVPVARRPTAEAALRDNAIELDEENVEALLGAVFYQSRPLPGSITLEGYVIGLRELDGALAASSNRLLLSPGVRALRAPAAGEVDFQLEAVLQAGRSRASAAATDTTDLEHLAGALHASAGYRFDAPWAPRLALQFDFATGDRSPDDRMNNRFDPLFGARRFELGPTGLWGAIGRSNVVTPGLRFELTPDRTLDAFAAYRLVWLASSGDAWTAADLRDPSGASGDFVGQQVEGRVRWHVVPRSVSFDVGGAAFIRGDFAARAPRGEASPSGYFYAQLTGTL